MTKWHSVAGLLVDSSGRLWAGTLGGRFSLWDGEAWHSAARLSGKETRAIAVPDALYPTRTVWVRMCAQDDPCNLQVYTYRYEAPLEGDVPNVMGNTAYMDILKEGSDLTVEVKNIQGPDTLDQGIYGRLSGKGNLKEALDPTGILNPGKFV